MLFEHGLIPVINKPTRITKRSATAIDHIITNTIINTNIKTGIIKSDISDHFPIFLIANPELDSHPLDTTILKRLIDEKSTNNFKTLLSEVNWDDVYKLNSPNTTYDLFIQTFTDLYDKCFRKVKIKLKTKSLLSPWITKGLKKSSKRKQKLYDKFLKNKSYKNELKVQKL